MKSHGSQLTIAFDTWTLASRFRNMGIYVYARQLLSHFREIATGHSVEFRPFVSAAESNDASGFEASSGFRPCETRLLNLDRAWRFGGACLAAFLSNADLLFCPSGNTLPVDPLVPVVTTIHDVTPIVLPAYPQRIARSLRFALANSAKLSRAIITDSICSKEDLMTVYSLPESKIHVVYLGCDETTFNGAKPALAVQADLNKRLGLERPYILHHGTVQPRKNLVRLIEAYRLAISQNPILEFDLVLVGGLGWQYEEILVAAQTTAGTGRVILAGPQSNADLATLLKGATLVVIPSLYEGFCLPMVEAMACGAPVICSNTSCLPEISGGVLKYFNPLSVEEMAASIKESLEDSSLRQALRIRGKERARKFSWERCAEETLTVLKSAVLN